MDCLNPQKTSEIQLVVMTDRGEMSTGKKRNWLLNKAIGEYVAHIDDDDLISDDYIKLVMEGIEKNVDCCSLKGIITFDGLNRQVFEHSIKYKEYLTNKRPNADGVLHERFPNHLNTIKASIAKRFTFPDKNHSEDTEWAMKVFQSKLINTEHYIPSVIYYYEYRSNK